MLRAYQQEKREAEKKREGEEAAEARRFCQKSSGQKARIEESFLSYRQL